MYETATLIGVLAFVYGRKQLTTWTGSAIQAVVNLIRKF